ncbi:MAG: efflux transporter outer membrane subunit [Parachlamydia sp.]|nr:efflux transporter outer membrane subunit [Parachlamydia sp.]
MRLLILFLLLTGCMRVGPDFKAPETTKQETWTEESHITVEPDEVQIGTWWQHYQDETLNDLVDYALKENYTLEAAAWRIVAARANLGFAIGEYFPQLQQAEGLSHRIHISQNAPNTLPIDRDYWDNILGFRISWEMDFWGRFARGVQAAYGDYEATKDDYRDVQRLLISDIVLDYVQLRTFQHRIEVLDRNIADQKRSVEIAKVRWEEGYESELDYAQAVTLWKETMAQKVALEIELKRVTTSLAILLGLTPEEFIHLFCLNSKPIMPPLNASIGYPAQVLYQRPDLMRTLDLLYAQSARVGIAVSDLYPRISFTGFLGLECAGKTDSTFNQHGKHLFSRKSLTFFYGPDFVWPILNYGRLENRIREQYAILDEGIALYRNQVLQAYKEVEDALTFFAKSIEETDNLEQSFKAAKRAVDISLIQYNEGLADYTRVLNSLQLQVAAEEALAQAQGNIGLAYANIYRAFGGFSTDPVTEQCQEDN